MLIMLFALLAACKTSSSVSASPQPAPGVSIAERDGTLFAYVNMCGDTNIVIKGDGVDQAERDRLTREANTVAAALGVDPDSCPPQPDAEHIAEVEAHEAELANRCDDLFVRVGDPNIYERHTVCPDDPWAALTRTNKCEDMTIQGEDDRPSFQCRPVIEPPS